MNATCRSCGSKRLHEVLDLGAMPLVNDLWTTPDGQGRCRHPLVTYVCESCTLMQLAHEVDPSALFREYTYLSSYSQTMIDHAAALADRMTYDLKLHRRSLVIELASNDGYLLQHYLAKGIGVLGVEPAANVAEIARVERGIPTLSEFFSSRMAEHILVTRPRADVVHAHNVLAHVPDPRDFLRGIHTLLHEQGVAVIEVPHVQKLVDDCQFDTIYHEHLCYFSLHALMPMFEHAGLSVFDVERVAIHGGSLRLFAARNGSRLVRRSVADILRDEEAWGVADPETYRHFGERAREARDEIRRFVDEMVATGHRVAGYGASAKGCVLLNFAGIDHSQVEFVVDRSPHKVGKYIPGTGIPIAPVDDLVRRRPDRVFLLVWNIADEVLRQQEPYLRGGGRFVVPVPHVRLVA